MAADRGHAHAEARLRREKIAWLTTVRRDGQPQSSPVWFLWRDGEIVVYSKPTTQKVRNVQTNAKVAVHRYRAMIRDINMDPDSFAKSYSVPVRIRPTKIRVE